MRSIFPVKIPLIGNKLDLAYFWQSWLNYHASVADKAFAFHYALAQGFAELATNQARKYRCRTIVLSGGVMHNQLLRRLLKRKSEANSNVHKCAINYQWVMADSV